jgi:RNA polymerase sigma factor (TIGR02999 family)
MHSTKATRGRKIKVRTGPVREGECVSDTGSQPITELLQRWRDGDSAAADALLPMVYAQLRAIARRQLARGYDQASLVPTELVHEAYLRLNEATPNSESRVHFFAIAARAMRQVLVAHERQRRADKRDGGERISLSSLDPADPNQSFDLLALDEALRGLEAIDARGARVIELRVFAGLDFAEIAQVVGISRATLARDFRASRAWLYKALSMTPQEGSI